MNKISSISVFLILLIVLCKSIFARNLELKQVFILSRHNVRNPLGEQLHRYSPKPWPPLTGSPGFLTPRGRELEGYMGKYFSEWLRSECLITEGCPDEDTVLVYANTLNRTKATAQAFVDSAFKGCNVPVHYKNITGQDPIFQCIIHNTTDAFKDMLFQEISKKLQNNKLKAVYKEINKILEIEGSEVCKQDGICDLTEANDTILLKDDKEVEITGPFTIGHDVMDVFVMNYYDGVPIQDIAWGEITTPEKWQFLTEMGRQSQDVKFTTAAKDIGAPLIEYLSKTFKNYDEMPTAILLFGHDCNINTVITSMGFQSIDLPNTYEKFPIGGKLVFQRWTDGESDYLKVEYVYASWSQVRNGTKFSLENPPQIVKLQLKWCNTDERGFCSWTEFVNKL